MDQAIENEHLDNDLGFEIGQPVQPSVKVEPVIGQPQQIPKKGRPKVPRPEDLAENEDKANEIREARRLPSTPGPHCNFEQMNKWVCMLTDDMWSHVSVYQYRTYPAIIRQLADEDAEINIDKLVKEHFDNGLEEYIRITHGGGRYKFFVKDLDVRLPKGGNKTIMEATLNIPIDDCMPKLNLAELDRNNKINVGYLNLLVSRGVIDTKGNPVMQPAVVQAGGDPTALANALGGMFDKFMGMYAKMSSDQQATLNKMMGDGNQKGGGINEIFLEKLKQEDPNKQFTMLSTMLDKMTGMIPHPLPPKDDSAMWQMILKMQSDNSKEQMAMMTKMMELNAANSKPSGGDGDSWIDKVIKYKDLMPGLFGGSTTVEGKKSTTELVIDGIKEFGLPLIGIGSQLLQAKGFNPIVPVTPQQAQEMVNPSNHQPMTGRVRQPSQDIQQENQRQRILQMPTTNQPQPTTTQPTSSSQPGQPLPVDPNQLSITQKIFMQFGGMLVTAIKSGKSGAEIGELLQANQMFFGDDIYAILKGQGYEQIIGTMKGIPEFWNQTGAVLGDAHMEQLVREFLNYEQFLTNDEEDEEDENGGGLPSAT